MCNQPVRLACGPLFNLYPLRVHSLHLSRRLFLQQHLVCNQPLNHRRHHLCNLLPHRRFSLLFCRVCSQVDHLRAHQRIILRHNRGVSLHHSLQDTHRPGHLNSLHVNRRSSLPLARVHSHLLCHLLSHSYPRRCSLPFSHQLVQVCNLHHSHLLVPLYNRLQFLRVSPRRNPQCDQVPVVPPASPRHVHRSVRLVPCPPCRVRHCLPRNSPRLHRPMT